VNNIKLFGCIFLFIEDYIMLPYKEKVFREKPYTQCFECIQGPKLKCKGCMSTLIADILRHKANNDPFHKENTKTPRSNGPSTPLRKCRTVQGIQHRQPTPDQRFEIRTNFGLWVEKMQLKRTDSYDVVEQTLAQWPHRKAAGKQKINKIEQARFENWESRLL
jgi:hypothetical protein